MAKPNVTFRDFRPEDLPVLHAVRNAAFAPVYKSFRSLTGPGIAPIAFAAAEDEQGAFLDGLCKVGDDKKVIVAECGAEIVGFAAMTLDHAKKIGEIQLTAVHPDKGGRGVGTAMFEHCLTFMRDRGMEIAAVGTGGDESHAPARRAYEKAGFDRGLPSVYLYKKL